MKIQIMKILFYIFILTNISCNLHNIVNKNNINNNIAKNDNKNVKNNNDTNKIRKLRLV